MLHQSGVRKKKGLTDLVEIIPFPNQELRKRVSGTPKKSLPKKQNSFQLQNTPKPTVLSAPSGKLKSSVSSIKKMMEKSNSPDVIGGEKLSNEVKNKEDFDFDALKMYWRRFAQIKKESSEKTYYNALIKREPILGENNLITMEVDNEIQVNVIEKDLNQLTNYLRKELKNDTILIKMIITENQEQDIRYKTGKDRFASLAQKNPNLNTLKNTFNLDIEY